MQAMSAITVRASAMVASSCAGRYDVSGDGLHSAYGRRLPFRLGSSTRVRFGGWAGRVYLLIVILFPSDGRVIFLAAPTWRSAMPFDNPHQTPVGDAKLLRDARSRVSSRSDWVQGRFQDGNRLCIVGALSLVSSSRSFNTPNRLERRLARVLVSQLPSERPVWARFRCFTARQRLTWFNDARCTSHADVMALFNRAIDRSTVQAFISV
jgi:hypothetical protein